MYGLFDFIKYDTSFENQNNRTLIFKLQLDDKLLKFRKLKF